jgi:hypothetical protein
MRKLRPKFFDWYLSLIFGLKSVKKSSLKICPKTLFWVENEIHWMETCPWRGVLRIGFGSAVTPLKPSQPVPLDRPGGSMLSFCKGFSLNENYFRLFSHFFSISSIFLQNLSAKPTRSEANVIILSRFSSKWRIIIFGDFLPKIFRQFWSKMINFASINCRNLYSTTKYSPLWM